MHAIFLRHEGFLGALGALLSNENLENDDLILEDSKGSLSNENLKNDDLILEYSKESVSNENTVSI